MRPSVTGVSPTPARAEATVDGRRLVLSNLDKALYPEAGFTKAEVIDYYVRIAPVMLPHLKNRPVTRKRFPEGTGKDGFFEKQRPMGTPDWVRTVTVSVSGSTMARSISRRAIGVSATASMPGSMTASWRCGTAESCGLAPAGLAAWVST